MPSKPADRQTRVAHHHEVPRPARPAPWDLPPGTILRIEPAPELAPFVEGYYVYSNGFGADVVLPNGGFDILLGLEIEGRPTHWGRNLLHGLTQTVFATPPNRAIHSFNVRFWPGGIQPFLPTPMPSVSGRTVEIAGLPRLHRLGRISRGGPREIAERIEELEALLYEQIEAAPVPSELRNLLEVLRHAVTARDHMTPGGLALHLGVGARNLQRAMRRYCGIDAQALCGITRLARCLALKRSTGRGWADAAGESGYADQAQFVRQAKAITGLTPRRLDESIRAGRIHPRSYPLRLS